MAVPPKSTPATTCTRSSSSELYAKIWSQSFILHSTAGSLLIAGSRAEERCAPGADGQQRSKQDDGVDTGPSFPNEINIFQVQPQREFVKRESGAQSV